MPDRHETFMHPGTSIPRIVWETMTEEQRRAERERRAYAEQSGMAHVFKAAGSIPDVHPIIPDTMAPRTDRQESRLRDAGIKTLDLLEGRGQQAIGLGAVVTSLAVVAAQRIRDGR